MLLETMFYLEIIQTKGSNLLEYADVAKATIGLMKADHQETDNATIFHWEIPQGPPTGPNIKFAKIILSLEKLIHRATKILNVFC